MKYFEQKITTLTDSNITQDWDDWDSSTTYTYEEDDSLTNASVVTYNNYYWRSASINNTDTPSETSLKWAYLNGTKEDSVSNKLALLDDKSGTRTTLSGSDLYVEFEKNQITTIVIGSFSASKVKIEQLDETKTAIEGYTQEFDYYPSFGVFDAWTYGTAPYVYETSSNKLISIMGVGKYIKITFYQTTEGKVSVGFLFGGNPIYVGTTVEEINSAFTSYKTETDGTTTTIVPAQTMTFQTQAPREYSDQIRQIIATLRTGVVRAYIVDDTPSTLYNNLIILGELQSAPLTIDSFDEHITSWTIYENK